MVYSNGAVHTLQSYPREFRAIWKDLLSNPLEFGTPEFLDISQLYCLRTSSRYFLLRISPEMETQLRFLLTYVRWGLQKHYQEWFARKFSCRDEAEESHSSGSLNSFSSTSQEGSGSIIGRFSF
ncbi:hypothetical protein MKX03_013744 [Papaver bracteatum]|nr:hypothetical protein MKX03_013744 [Papaver bracteatum]